MIEFGETLHAADTAFVRARSELVYTALADPFGHPAFWPRLRTLDHKVGVDEEGRPHLAIGDRWRIRALLGLGGIDVEAEVTDLRSRGGSNNVWMDWRGTLDPVVGLTRRQRVFEAETEWWIRPWGPARAAAVADPVTGAGVAAAQAPVPPPAPISSSGTLVSIFWRVRAEPQRRQQRLLANLRRLGWRAMHGVKFELEGRQ